MTNKEQIICKYKFQDKEKFDGKPYCTCFNELCEDLTFVCDHNCQIYEDYKQRARKTQECESLKEELNFLKNNEDLLISNLQVLWGKQIAEEQGDCKNIDYSKPRTKEIYHKITEIERTLKDVAFAQSVQMKKTQPLGETGSPRSYRNWERKERNLLERRLKDDSR